MDGGREAVSMVEFVYLVGAVYLAFTLARLVFWVVDIIDGRR